MAIVQYFVRKSGVNYVLLSFNFEREGNTSVDQTPFEVSKSNGANLSIGDDVSIGYMDGASFVDEFSGDIVSKSIGETSKYTLESYGGRINRNAHFSQIFNSQTPEAIAENIIDNQATTLTYASSTSSGITIDQFVVKNETPGEAIGRLVELLNWQIRTDNDKNFYFEPVGTTTNTTTITIGTNAYLKTNWSESPNNLVNNVTLIGGDAVYNTNQSFTATASQTVFTVNEKIVGNVRVTDNGTEVVGGTSESTSSYDYEVNLDNKTITFVVGRTVGHTIIVYYDFSIPIRISSRNDSSISANSIFSKKVTDSTIKNMSDARKRAKQILKEGELTKQAIINVLYDSDYQVGETVHTIDTFNDVDQQVVISKLNFSYPKGIKSVEVGNARKNMLNWNVGVDARLKALESKQDNSDRIQQYIQIIENINVTQRVGRVRVQTHSLGNAWIVGSSTNGLVGTNTGTVGGGQQVVGAGGRGDKVVASVQNYNDTFYERFNFNNFIDTGATTATLDTSNEDIDFTNAQILKSLSAQKGSTVTKATLTSDSTTNLTFEMTADNSNWESVTSGTEHSFTNTGTDLRYRATASGVATISLITISYE